MKIEKIGTRYRVKHEIGFYLYGNSENEVLHKIAILEKMKKGRYKMNKYCFRNCAYNDICNLDEENTAQCKVAEDKETQDFKRSTIFGIKTEDLLAMQYKTKKD